MSEQALSVKEKIGYGMGDAASHIVFDNVMLYMMFFYTDIFGIPAGFVGTMFLLARALDAISDPAMGLIADRTRSRWGKFRPWVLFGALPFGVVCVFAYSTPELSLSGKMIYAAVTYTLLTLMYTVVNIPYCALGGVITSDPQQRISLQSWRFVLATAGGMLSTVLMMPLVNFFGGEDKAFGFQAGIAVLAAVAFLMLAFCFFTTKERVEAPPNTSTMREDLRDILQNDQWRVVGVLTILNILAVCVRGGAMMYYVTWIMGDAALFSWFLGLYCVGNLFGSALAKPLTDWKCKVSVFWWTNAARAVLSVAMFFVPMSATVVMFVFIFVIGVLHQLVTPIQWVMMSDTVDYGEWRNGKRLTGISFAGTLIGWMLAGGGYDAAAKTQNSATLTIIVSLFTLAPGICYVLSAIIAKRYYTLKTPFLKNILAELAKSARHNQREFETLPVSKTFQKSKG
ncbi:glycoside-pentoside-hexuronide family transporter [Cronobacter sakazakii]|uniref:glycoside-pentoside-hexuronide family transporter n=1 Tax=Cronobacter sakazakii TaxID=28141 RepID=UPI000BE7DA05|nr:glycoside-pentoside-hexuronide family transporter [Cronobacter sakazakii]PQV89258.1 glycoside-pentoside-hexuronide family transporter [Cronobacter sakazakii]PQV93391.1 glycoside-pentoside-hexuronide family transporter [Cronobacter sakazakii]PQX93855.1 glycoside-pentoside-hexuronide family transporter [Cronobacter sakazakii]PUV61210.1 glycoside-pentoside-hexuronide family transporter [Cronobacter sakazakii]